MQGNLTGVELSGDNGVTTDFTTYDADFTYDSNNRLQSDDEPERL